MGSTDTLVHGGSAKAALIAASVFIVCFGASEARAQTVEPLSAQDQPLQEIVVTARKRTESLSSIPLSISAYTSADIRDLGVQGLSDLTAMTTGVKFLPRASGGIGGRGGSEINIRGVAGLGGRTPVSLFIDGVYVLGGASVIPLYDLERVEVIKGPQSAFFGRNTFAGAVSYITRDPSLQEYKTQLDASGTTRSDFDINVLTSGPIIQDRLGFSLDLRNYVRGRQFTATDGGGLGEEGSKSAALVLFAKPIEPLSVKVRVFYQQDDDGPGTSAYFQAGLLAPTCQGRQVAGLDSNGSPATLTLGKFWCGQVPSPGSQYAPRVSTNTSLFPSSFAQVRRAYDAGSGTILPAQARPDFLITNAIDQPLFSGVPTLDRMGERRDIFRASLNANYDLPSGHSVTLTAGYNKMETNNLYDYDRTDTQAWWASGPSIGEDRSVEIRVASPGKERLRWLAGATYYDQTFKNASAGGVLISGCISGLTGFPPFGVCDEAHNGVGPAFTRTGLTGDVATVSGVYGSLSFDITDKWTVDLEGRYLRDTRTNNVTAGTFAKVIDITYNQVTPRLILSYKPSNSTLVYAQASRGVLPGVLNSSASICSQSAFTVAYVSPITGQPSTASECAQLASQLPGGKLNASTDSQTLDAYEMGWKQSSFDRRLHTSLTGYFYQWKNLPSQQRPIYVMDASDPNKRDGIPNAFATTLAVNVSGSQNLWGTEFEANFQATRNLNLLMNASWNKNKWTNFHSTTARYYPSSDMEGLQRVNYPEWLGTAMGTYTRDMSSGWQWYSRLEANYTGKQWVDLANVAWLNDFWIVNGAVGFKREGTRIELYAKNLLGEDAWVNGQLGIDFATFGDWAWKNDGIGLVPQDKRTVGIRVSHTF